MPVSDVQPTAPAPPEADLSRTYLLVLVVEAIVIAVLYWLGKNFS
jgi:hypothetical protein